MALQKVFKRGYMDYLKNNIRVADYLQETFPIDKTQVVPLHGLNHPEGLLELLDPSPDGDLQTAIAIYEAYPDISPLMAQQDDLWVYLTHADLFQYVKKRWPNIETGGKTKDPIGYITNHWFGNHQFFLRTTFAGLWWNIYLTIDDSRSNKYELSEFLFKNQEFRTTSFGELPLIRHREAMIGILEFLKENQSLFESGFNGKARYIRHLFDVIGGYKNLSSLKRDYFKSTLYKYLNTLATIRDAKEAKAGADIYNEIQL